MPLLYIKKNNPCRSAFSAQSVPQITNPCESAGFAGGPVHVFVQEYYSLACVYIYRYVCLEKGWGGLYLCIGERNFLIVLNSR
jgi:hypothetical protein